MEPVIVALSPPGDNNNNENGDDDGGSSNIVTTNSIEHQRSEYIQKGSRARKTALGQQANKKLFDINGNRAIIRRMSSFALPENVSSDVNDNDPENVDLKTSGEWENSLIEQLHELLKNGKDSKIAICADETQGPAGKRRGSSVGVNKSCNSECVGVKQSRRPSLTANEFLSKPRVSNAGLFNVRAGRGRRSSVATSHFSNPSSVAYSGKPPVGSRRVSCASIDNSRVINPGRRYSVALVSGANPQVRRSSRCSDAFFGALPRQRRKSSAKPVSFPVSTVKISTSQKRLQYRMRRRKDRAHVNLAEVRRAISADVNEYELVDDCDDQSRDNESDQEQDFVDEAIDEPDKQEVDARENEACENVPEVTNTDRRRTSIQVRAWELSRRLRQRRREKIKSCNM